MRRVGASPQNRPVGPGGLREALRDAVLVTVAASSVGLLTNLVRSERIPFIAEGAYEILVPCPEPGGPVSVMEADAALHAGPQIFLIDARSREAYATWRVGEALNVPFDYLDPTPPAVMEDLARRTARSKAQRVVVYGDGGTPDSGEQLAKELSARGIKNVFFVGGGAPAMMAVRGQAGGS